MNAEHALQEHLFAILGAGRVEGGCLKYLLRVQLLVNYQIGNFRSQQEKLLKGWLFEPAGGGCH